MPQKPARLTKMQVKLSGLEHFAIDPVIIDIADNLTSFVGANGAGKSTLLESLAEVFAFFQECSIQGPISQVRAAVPTVRTTAPAWTSANLMLRHDGVIQLPPSLAEAFNLKEFRELTVGLTRPTQEGEVLVEWVEADRKRIEIDLDSETYVVDSKRKLVLERQLESVRSKLAALSKEQGELKEELKLSKMSANKTVINENSQKYTKAVQARNSYAPEAERLETELTEEIEKAAKTDVALRNGQVDKAELESLIGVMSRGMLYLHGDNALETHLSDLRQEFRLLARQAGADRDGSSYQRLRRELEQFLHAEVFVEGEGDDFRLLVEHRPIKELSRGTHAALGFFAICRHVGKAGLVLWDEPENSMHPMRRNQLVSLMTGNPRRFVVATHQTEFTPVFDESSRIYRLESRFVEDRTSSSISPVDRKLTDAYDILRILGMEPAKVLFTPNVVVWVEGPSDAIYWRVWLKHHARAAGVELLEGFDFCFLFTGGSLLASQTVTSLAGPTDDGILNLLSVCSSSIVIADTDVDTGDLESINAKLAPAGAGPFESQEHLRMEMENGSLRNSPWRVLLKPRVRNFLNAVEKLGDESGQFLLTWGRETENYISNQALRACTRGILARGEYDISGVEDEAIDTIVVGRWDSFDEIILRTLGAARWSRVLHSSTENDEVKSVRYARSISGKLDFARTYEEQFDREGDEFDWSHHCAIPHVAKVYDYIVERKRRS